MHKIGLLAACLVLLGVASAPADDMGAMKMPGHGASPSDKAYADSMQKMMQDMQAKPSGNADKDFATMMIPHHQGAIDMAKVELQYGTDPMLRKLAQDIVKAQETEIAQMKAWLAQH